MPEGKLFNCPSCGSSLAPQANQIEIQCSYCGNRVIIPEELRQTAITVSPATTRWIKISIWAFVIVMIASIVIPLLCSLLGIGLGLAGAFIPFLVR